MAMAITLFNRTAGVNVMSEVFESVEMIQFICPTISFVGGDEEIIGIMPLNDHESIITIDMTKGVVVEIDNTLVKVMLGSVNQFYFARFTSNKVEFLTNSSGGNSIKDIGGNQQFTIRYALIK